MKNIGSRFGNLKAISRVLKPGGRFCIIGWELPASLLRKIFFSLSIGLLEPRGFSAFLLLDWGKMLEKYSFILEKQESCDYSKLLVSQKEGGA